jgi:hypothetical protein
MARRRGTKKTKVSGTDTPRGDPEVTERVRKVLSDMPTMRLVSIGERIMDWWEEAERGNKEKFSAVRGMIFEMNEWLGYPKERIFVENIVSGDPKQVVEQYSTILLALAGERMGEGELLICPEAWGRLGTEICTIGGKPYKDYVIELSLLVFPKEGESHISH